MRSFCYFLALPGSSNYARAAIILKLSILGSFHSLRIGHWFLKLLLNPALHIGKHTEGDGAWGWQWPSQSLSLSSIWEQSNEPKRGEALSSATPRMKSLDCPMMAWTCTCNMGIQGTNKTERDVNLEWPQIIWLDRESKSEMGGRERITAGKTSPGQYDEVYKKKHY